MQTRRNLHENPRHHHVKETPRDKTHSQRKAACEDVHRMETDQYDHRGEADGDEDNRRTQKGRNN